MLWLKKNELRVTHEIRDGLGHSIDYTSCTNFYISTNWSTSSHSMNSFEVIMVTTSFCLVFDLNPVIFQSKNLRHSLQLLIKGYISFKDRIYKKKNWFRRILESIMYGIYSLPSFLRKAESFLLRGFSA